MIRSALTVVSLLALALPAGAQAQTFAGGSIGPSGAHNDAPGTSELGFRVDGGRITVRGVAVIACRANKTSEVEGTASGPLNPDGTFSLTFTKRRLQKTLPGRFTRRVTVTGQVRNGNEIVGRIEATASGRGVSGCRGAFDYLARTAPALGSTGVAAPANATLIGMTSQRRGGPYGVALRVSPDAAGIARFNVGARYTCRRLRPYQETNYSPSFRVNPDGTFRFVERFTLRYTDARERVRITTVGRFVEGGATGTWQARSVARSRRTGRVADRCRTGRHDWSAAVV
jgi:hypothetical protein